MQRTAKFFAAMIAAHYLALGKQIVRVLVGLASLWLGGVYIVGGTFYLISGMKGLQIIGLCLLVLGLGYLVVAGMLAFSKQVISEFPNAHYLMELEDEKVLQESIKKLAHKETSIS